MRVDEDLAVAEGAEAEDAAVAEGGMRRGVDEAVGAEAEDAALAEGPAGVDEAVPVAEEADVTTIVCALFVV